MSEAERLRDDALRAQLRVVSAPLPFVADVFAGVRALGDERLAELRVEALRAVRALGLEAMPWASSRALVGRVVAASLVDPMTLDEAQPSPLVAEGDVRFYDDAALDALLAVYTRHVGALARGGPHVP
ncbi:MAG: hypothetical protein K1X94_03250 [Sandaracinaceae bacterium]|nr:hypothetical protein [Sandaracinaceae bacterium]